MPTQAGVFAEVLLSRVFLDIAPIFCNHVFQVKRQGFNIYATLLWATFYNLTIICKPLEVFRSTMHGVIYPRDMISL